MQWCQMSAAALHAFVQSENWSDHPPTPISTPVPLTPTPATHTLKLYLSPGYSVAPTYTNAVAITVAEWLFHWEAHFYSSLIKLSWVRGLKQTCSTTQRQHCLCMLSWVWRNTQCCMQIRSGQQLAERDSPLPGEWNMLCYTSAYD